MIFSLSSFKKEVIICVYSRKWTQCVVIIHDEKKQHKLTSQPTNRFICMEIGVVNSNKIWTSTFDKRFVTFSNHLRSFKFRCCCFFSSFSVWKTKHTEMKGKEATKQAIIQKWTCSHRERDLSSSSSGIIHTHSTHITRTMNEVTVFMLLLLFLFRFQRHTSL